MSFSAQIYLQPCVLLPRIYYLRLNMLKFKEIMSTSNPKLLNKLSKFTYLALNTRKEYVRRELLQTAS